MKVPPKTWKQVFERDRAFCFYCGADLLESFAAYWSATVDHVIPISAGGGDEAGNLVCCCPGCNSMLSRFKPETNDPEKEKERRKSFVQQRIEEEMDGYNNWRLELREN